jgi:predicted DNA-binding mobile mystery protein A
MLKRQNSQQARTSLDAKFVDGSVRAIADRPVRGWIRAVRDSLGMNTRQLAARMGQSQSAVTQLERSEVDGRARLDSLRRAADALGCDFVYAFVPRSSLDAIVRDRALELARQDLTSIDRTMRLEAQALEESELEQRIANYAARLVSEGRLWDEEQG